MIGQTNKQAPRQTAKQRLHLYVYRYNRNLKLYLATKIIQRLQKRYIVAKWCKKLFKTFKKLFIVQSDTWIVFWYPCTPCLECRGPYRVPSSSGSPTLFRIEEYDFFNFAKTCKSAMSKNDNPGSQKFYENIRWFLNNTYFHRLTSLKL